jgi:hypothetical protein
VHRPNRKERRAKGYRGPAFIEAKRPEPVQLSELVTAPPLSRLAERVRRVKETKQRVEETGIWLP